MQSSYSELNTITNINQSYRTTGTIGVQAGWYTVPPHGCTADKHGWTGLVYSWHLRVSVKENDDCLRSIWLMETLPQKYRNFCVIFITLMIYGLRGRQLQAEFNGWWTTHELQYGFRINLSIQWPFFLRLRRISSSHSYTVQEVFLLITC